MALIRWSEKSLLHLERIHAWIAKDSPLQAGRMVEQIWNRTQVLADSPKSATSARQMDVPKFACSITVTKKWLIATILEPIPWMCWASSTDEWNSNDTSHLSGYTVHCYP